MTPRPPGLLGTLRLLAALSLRRTANRMSVVFRRRPRRSPDGGSPAAARRGGGRRGGFGGVLLLVVLALCVLNFGFMGYQVFSRIADAAEQEAAGSVTSPPLSVGPLAFGILSQMQDERDASLEEAAREVAEGDPAEREAELLARQEGQLRLMLPDPIRWETPHGAGAADRDEVIRRYREDGLDAFREDRPFGALREQLWPGATVRPLFELGATAILTLLLLALLLSSLGSGNVDLGRVEWSMEWLFTFPAATGTLVTARLLEYALVSPLLWFAVGPTVGVLALSADMPIGASLITAAAGVVALGLLLGSARLLVETLLRQRLSLARLKNVQAGCTLLGMAGMFVVLYVAVSQGSPTWLPLAMRHLPAAGLAALPTGKIVHAAGLAPYSSAWWQCLGTALAAAGAVAALAAAGCARLLRDGLLVSANVRQGTRGRPEHEARAAGFGVLGKELRLLLRDRNFLVQTTVVPAFIIGWQFIANPRLLDAAANDPRHAAAMAFGVGAYVLMFGAMATFGSEGNALWLLYTLPRPLDGMLRQKTLLWAAIALLYTNAALAFVFGPRGLVDPDVLLAAGPALLGVAIYSYIAAGMGVLGWSPELKQTGRRVRSGAAYAYMLLASCYAYGIYARDPWNRAVVIFLCALLAYSIWQTVQERLPLILDSSSAPAPAITLSDGVTAAFLFFVAQGLLGIWLLYGGSGDPTLLRVLLMFAGAGLLVMAGTLLVFRRRGMRDIRGALRVRALEGATLARTLAWGVLGGIVCGGFGKFYVDALDRYPWLSHLRDKLPDADAGSVGGQVWMIVLAVVAAPIFEEFLFRGLLYQGLRRSFGPLCSVLTSAAVFAVVHPAVSVLPVFLMGLVAAIVFERSRSLYGSMLVHSVYNAMVVGLQLR